MGKKFVQLKQDEFFLDNVTGDLYSYSYESQEWIARGNTGLHYRKSAEEFQKFGKYIIKAPVYRPKNIKEVGEIFKNKHTEQIVFKKKSAMQHWATFNCPTQFLGIYKKKKLNLVDLNSSWDVHTFNFVNRNKRFEVLAESLRGPVIISFDNSILATHFEINKRYPCTRKILENFLHHKLNMLKSTKAALCKSILESPPSQIRELYNRLKMQKKKKNKEISFKSKKSANSNTFSRNLFRKSQINETEIESPTNANNEKNFKHVGFSAKKENSPEIVNNNAIANFIGKKKSKFSGAFEDSIKENPRFSQTFTELKKKNIIKRKNDEEEEISSRRNKEESLLMNTTEIIKKLHPTISKICLDSKKNDLWVPGELSKNQFNSTPNKKVVKVYNETINKFFKTSNKKHKNSEESSDIMPKSERIYETHFHHKFREVKKDKWLGGQFNGYSKNYIHFD